MSTDTGDPTPSADSAPTRAWRFDDVDFDLDASPPLRVKGLPVEVEPRPLQVLAELLRHAEEVVTKEELLATVWEGRPTVEHVLANAVSKLRNVLGAVGAARIITVPRMGYRLVGPVECMATTASASRTNLEVGQPVPGRASFVLERRLGGGGQSDVWLARHARLGQVRVFKFASGSVELGALKREFTLYRVLRRELGERDDFAVVLDSRFDTAPYFLECEYGGLSLLEWGQEGGRLAATALPERLALFGRIANAVAAAHSVGVLHKDIKPGNVLVDEGEAGERRVRLTDFGSGRLMDPGRLTELRVTALGLTQTQQVLPDSRSGTLMYLAPEVLVGRAPSMQSDVYALGVLLYQLAVADLQRPLATGWEREIGDGLLHDDIRAATEGDPAARLSSAAALRERVASLEQRREVRSALERRERDAALALDEAQRRRARRPWVVASLAILGIGMLVSFTMYLRAREALSDAQAQAKRAAAVGDFLHRDVLEAADVQTLGVAIRRGTYVEILRKAAGAASTRFAGEPLTEAVVHRRLAETFLKLASLIDAGSELRRSIELLESQGVASDDSELLISKFLRARHLAWTGQHSEADAVLLSTERAAGLDRLSRPSELAFFALRAKLEEQRIQGKANDALASARRLVGISDSVFRPGSPEQLVARQSLAYELNALGDQAGADQVINDLTHPPFNLTQAPSEFRATVLIEMSESARHNGRFDDSLKAAEGCQRLIESTGNFKNQFIVAWCKSAITDAQEVHGKFPEAMQAALQARDGFQELFGNDHQYVISLNMQIARLTRLEGNATAAMTMFDSIRSHQKKVYGGDVLNLVLTFEVAMCQLDLGNYRNALGLLNSIDSRDLNRQLDLGELGDAPERVLFSKGRAMVGLGQKQEGRKLMEAALKSMEKKVALPWLKKRYQDQLRSVG